jgi:rare lipoprotein A
MRRTIWFLMAILFGLANLGASPPPPDRTEDRTKARVPPKAAVKQSKPQTLKGSTQNLNTASQVGIASWYGRYFHGRLTASGEPYDMFQLTAAHRTLKLGTWVKVTNLRNGRSVMLRINDRGPVPTSRIIDVSLEAATVLDFRARGLEKVRVDVIKPAAVAAALTLDALP